MLNIEELIASGDVGAALAAAAEDKWGKLRRLRSELLNDSDRTQLADAPLTDTKKAEWATYRQALRDMPIDNSSATVYEDIVWPTKPS
tara:strand:+ start:3303 stop:3566 length:264 start_codon:yes stop_codon:yes gene_type:complete